MPETTDETGDAETDSAQVRWPYTNDLAAGVLVLAYLAIVALTGAGLLALEPVPVNLRLGLVAFTGIAIAWLFGPAAVQAWSDFRSGPG